MVLFCFVHSVYFYFATGNGALPPASPSRRDSTAECHNAVMTQSTRPPSLAAAALRWQRDSFRSRGFVGSLRYLAEQFIECVKDSLPERRRSRFGDIDYDCDHAVDTTWARLPLSVRLREVFSERLYQPTVEEEFGVIMQHFAAIDLQTYTFIDLGSGKGRALLLAAMYPFARIVGVEVQPELDAIALQNIERFANPGQRCHRIESLRADAREYFFPSTDIVLYLFNPFPDYVLREVLANLVASARQAPRSIYVLYNAPFEQQEFARVPELQCFYACPQYQLYSIPPL
jgi:SAM-dependent methyltransferase